MSEAILGRKLNGLSVKEIDRALEGAKYFNFFGFLKRAFLCDSWWIAAGPVGVWCCVEQGRMKGLMV